MQHCSTPSQQIAWIFEMLTSPRGHGMVSQLSRDHHVSRQTLYRWKEKAEKALHEAFDPKPRAEHRAIQVERDVLMLLIEAHASYRETQTCLQSLLGISLSIGTICGLVQQAGERARAWMRKQPSSSVRALALDEQYSSKRGEAYFNVVDVHSGPVWSCVPPAPVDAESWMIVLWDLQAQGVSNETTVSDGGLAIHDALSQLNQLGTHQRDVWHVFQQAAKVQGRVERVVQHEEERLRSITS